VETAAIITTNASRDIANLHSRMPVVIAPDAYDLWLDCARCDALTASALLTPAPERLFEAYEVSPAVNRTANEGPELIEPVRPREAEPPARATLKPRKSKDERQPSLFDDL